MDTDKPLKVLFETCAELLLPLTGDAGAIVRAAGPAEIQALQRRADCVLQLERNGEIYYRHLEFEDRPDPAMAERCFQYNTLLIIQRKAPVLTTVIYIEPPKPKGPLVFRVAVGGREINRWAFEQICLWEMDARQSLRADFPGLAPLTPLMDGGRGLDVIVEALRCIQQGFPSDRILIAEEVLLALAGQHYTFSELTDLVGRDRMIQSSLYTEGLAEGRLDADRRNCLALARKHHPAALEDIRPLIEACTDPAKLEAWMLAASDVGDSEFVKLVREG